MKKTIFPLLLLAALSIRCGNDERKAPPTEREVLSFRPLASPADSLSRFPHLLADEESGRLWMSWTVQHRPDSASIWLAELDQEKGEWQQPSLLTSGSDLLVNWADYPHLTHNGKEPGILYLQVADPTAPYAYHVMWKQADQPPRRVHEDSSATEHGFVSTAPLPNGHLATIWLDGNKYAEAGGGHDAHDHGGEMTLRFRPLTADGQMLQAVELDGRTCDCCNTAMVGTSNGALAFYRDRSESEIRDIYYVRYQDGKWSSPKPLHEDGWEMRSCPVNGPAADAMGDKVAAAWFTGADGKQRVNVRFSENAGDSWGQPVVVDSLQPMGRVGVKLLPSGSALLSWLDKEGRLVVRQVDQQGKMGEVQTVAENLSSRKSGFPQLLRLRDKVYLAWTQPEPQPQIQVVEASLLKEL